MEIKFPGPVIFVKDIQASRRFYEDLLGQTVALDLGVNVGYVGGLAIWQREHAHEMIFTLGAGKSAPEPQPTHYNFAELVFETADLDEAIRRLDAAGVEWIHRLVEMPWRQRVARCYDPDGHMLELGEPMDVVVHRLVGQGLSVEDAAHQTGMPLPVVLEMLQAFR
jgi:catechol 2,3-dioxygenase-like lactoylglutathione lyase family enzyme